ncbi:MAG: hypothetical protein L6R40_004973 [Gallowayella cf. fulva]|nr:MAG: hypothetical protein L6R40_004973 [Xanthomendoza cf. fulva]
MVIALVGGPFNLVSDLYLLLMPLPAVWQLQLPLRKRLGVAGVFLTGSLACIASVVGLYYRILMYRSADRSWNLAPYLTTLVLELNIGTICASLPTLPAFYQHCRLKAPPLAAFQTFTNRFKTLGSSRTQKDHRLETGILESAQGEGKFLTAGDLINMTVSTEGSRVSSDGTLG